MVAVAPLTGSVDRNQGREWDGNIAPVAPLTGSVDRNVVLHNPEIVILMSLPSRGAWIEIFYKHPGLPSRTSLPSRGAWIEM